MTEQMMPWQIRAGMAEKFAQLPQVDHNGWTRKPADPEPEVEPELPPAAEAAPRGPQPDPSQGYQGLPVPSSDPRAKLRRALDTHPRY